MSKPYLTNPYLPELRLTDEQFRQIEDTGTAAAISADFAALTTRIMGLETLNGRLRADRDGWAEMYEAEKARVTALEVALRTILEDVPYVIDEATVPKAGIDAAPGQVVGTMHMALARRRALRKLLDGEK